MGCADEDSIQHAGGDATRGWKWNGQRGRNHDSGWQVRHTLSLTHFLCINFCSVFLFQPANWLVLLYIFECYDEHKLVLLCDVSVVHNLFSSTADLFFFFYYRTYTLRVDPAEKRRELITFLEQRRKTVRKERRESNAAKWTEQQEKLTNQCAVNKTN